MGGKKGGFSVKESNKGGTGESIPSFMQISGESKGKPPGLIRIE